MATPNTIYLGPYGGPVMPQERVCSEAMTPGHLIEYVPSGGDAGKYRKHATAGGNAAPIFALEETTPNRVATTIPIDTPYPSGDTVHAMFGRPGDCVYAWLPASAAAIVYGDKLVSNGDGTLKKGTDQAVNEGGSATYTLQAAAIVAISEETINNSAGGTPVRIRVRVI